MIDYAIAQARGKGEAPTASREGGQATTKALNMSHLPTTNGVTKLYCQLVEIHTIAIAQLVERTCWRLSDSTPSPVQAKTGR
jgi:hypothetical protein